MIEITTNVKEQSTNGGQTWKKWTDIGRPGAPVTAVK
jgi:hypothetical protein